jgi:Ca-activated chloride channel family protein
MRDVILLAVSAVAALLPGSARACDLALVLAVDVSGSVDPREYDLQMQGLALALRDPLVSEALVRAEAQVALVQWSGMSRQALTVPWTAVPDFVALEGFADAVEQSSRKWRNYSTAIGELLTFALPMFDAVPQCRRRVVDVSGDGPSNEGIAPEALRARLTAARVTVNAIAIEASEDDLAAYFFEHVIHGPGAFVVYADSYADYPREIRKKLLREVVKQTAGLAR